MYSDEEEGEYRMMQQQHQWNRRGSSTPVSTEFEELSWPLRFNPAIIPQYDEESNPREFLLKYKATIEATRRGPACKVKALILSLRGLAQHWYSNLPNSHIHAWDQLRAELAFRAMKTDKVTSCDFHNLS